MEGAHLAVTAGEVGDAERALALVLELRHERGIDIQPIAVLLNMGRRHVRRKRQMLVVDENVGLVSFVVNGAYIPAVENEAFVRRGLGASYALCAEHLNAAVGLMAHASVLVGLIGDAVDLCGTRNETGNEGGVGINRVGAAVVGGPRVQVGDCVLVGKRGRQIFQLALGLGAIVAYACHVPAVEHPPGKHLGRGARHLVGGRRVHFRVRQLAHPLAVNGEVAAPVDGVRDSIALFFGIVGAVDQASPAADAPAALAHRGQYIGELGAMIGQLLGGRRYIRRVAQVHALAGRVAHHVEVARTSCGELRGIGQLEALPTGGVGQAHRYRDIARMVRGIVQIMHCKLRRVPVGARSSREHRRRVEPREIEGELRVVVVVVVCARVIAQVVVEARVAVNAAAELTARLHETIGRRHRIEVVQGALVGRGVAVHPTSAHVVGIGPHVVIGIPATRNRVGQIPVDRRRDGEPVSQHGAPAMGQRVACTVHRRVLAAQIALAFQFAGHLGDDANGHVVARVEPTVLPRGYLRIVVPLVVAYAEYEHAVLVVGLARRAARAHKGEIGLLGRLAHIGTVQVADEGRHLVSRRVVSDPSSIGVLLFGHFPAHDALALLHAEHGIHMLESHVRVASRCGALVADAQGVLHVVARIQRAIGNAPVFGRRLGAVGNRRSDIAVGVVVGEYGARASIHRDGLPAHHGGFHLGQTMAQGVARHGIVAKAAHIGTAVKGSAIRILRLHGGNRQALVPGVAEIRHTGLVARGRGVFVPVAGGKVGGRGGLSRHEVVQRAICVHTVVGEGVVVGVAPHPGRVACEELVGIEHGLGAASVGRGRIVLDHQRRDARVHVSAIRRCDVGRVAAHEVSGRDSRIGDGTDALGPSGARVQFELLAQIGLDVDGVTTRIGARVELLGGYDAAIFQLLPCEVGARVQPVLDEPRFTARIIGQFDLSRAVGERERFHAQPLRIVIGGEHRLARRGIEHRVSISVDLGLFRPFGRVGQKLGGQIDLLHTEIRVGGGGERHMTDM